MKNKNRINISTIAITIILVSGISITLSAQKETPEKQYHRFKNEIGIDIQNIFSYNGSLGTSIVYKRRIGERTLISLNEKKAFRVRVGGSGDIALNDKDGYPVDTISFYHLDFYDELDQGFQFHALVGLEWQKQVKRIQYFYGLETGFRYLSSTRLIGWFYTPQIGYFYRFNVEISRAIPIIGLGGVKFFISQAFSISLETNIEVNYQFEKIDRNFVQRNTGMAAEIDGIKRKKINYNLDYLSALNFSYYF